MEDRAYIKFLENLKEEMGIEQDPIALPLFFQIDEIIKNFKSGGSSNDGTYTIISQSPKFRYTVTIVLNDPGYNLANISSITSKIKSINYKTERTS